MGRWMASMFFKTCFAHKYLYRSGKNFHLSTCNRNTFVAWVIQWFQLFNVLRKCSCTSQIDNIVWFLVNAYRDSSLSYASTKMHKPCKVLAWPNMALQGPQCPQFPTWHHQPCGQSYMSLHRLGPCMTRGPCDGLCIHVCLVHNV